MSALFCKILPPRLPSGWFLACCLVLATGAPRVSATTVIPPTFDQLVSRSDYIVRATVKSVTAEWRTDGANKHIISKVELEVSEVIAGTPPQPLVLEMLGGKIGTQEMRVEGAPKFQVGDEDILFVHGNGQQITPLVAMMHGRYPVMHDPSTGRAYMAREGRAPLYDEQEVALPMGAASSVKAKQPAAQPLSPEDFVARIKNSRLNSAKTVNEN